jgi:hypothetical protein
MNAGRRNRHSFMPYEIKKLASGQFAKIRKDTGKVVSRHATKAKAIGSILAEVQHTHEAMPMPGQSQG